MFLEKLITVTKFIFIICHLLVLSWLLVTGIWTDFKLISVPVVVYIYLVIMFYYFIYCGYLLKYIPFILLTKYKQYNENKICKVCENPNLLLVYIYMHWFVII